MAPGADGFRPVQSWRPRVHRAAACCAGLRWFVDPLHGVGSGAGDVVGWDGPPSVAEDLDLDEARVAGRRQRSRNPVMSMHPSPGMPRLESSPWIGVTQSANCTENRRSRLRGDLLGQRDVPPHVVRVEGDPDRWGSDRLDEVVGLAQ